MKLSALFAAVCALVLGLRVHTGLERVRVRLVNEARIAHETTLSIPLPEVTALAGEPAAMVIRASGGGAAARIRVHLDDVQIGVFETPALGEVRFDGPIALPAGSGHRLALAGDRSGWTLGYLELANVYGFSRGLVSFEIVPRERSRFPRVPLLLIVPIAIALLLLRPDWQWPPSRTARIAFRTGAAVVILLFAAVLLTDRFTQYRILIAAPTFALCVAILYAQRTLQGLRLAGAAGIAAIRAGRPAVRSVSDRLQAAIRWPHLPAAIAASVAVLVAGYAYVRGAHIAGGADSYGYVSQAELWATGRLHDTIPILDDLPRDVSDHIATPLGYVPHRAAGIRGRIVPSYSPGLPITMALFRLGGGPAAVFLVVPALAGLTVWLTFVLGRRMQGSATGLVAAGWLAASPAFISGMLVPMSDVPVTAWWTCAIVAATGTSTASAAVAGLATSLAILTRPNLAPLALAVVLPLLWALRVSPLRRAAVVRLAAFASSAAIGPAIVGLLFNYWYGSPLESGYGTFEELYGWEFVVPNLQRYPVWLVTTQTPAVLAAALAPLALADRRSSKGVLLLVLTIFTLLVWLSYLPYYPFETWEYLRFLLPSYPPLLVMAAAAIVSIAGRMPAAPAILTAAVTILAVHGGGYVRREGTLNVAHGEAKYRRVGDFVRSELPERAVLLSMQHSGSLRFYSGRQTLRYDWVPEARLEEILERLAARGYEPYFVLDDWEEDVFRERFAAVTPLGRLDWPPAAAAADPRVSIYNPRDRARSDTVTTRAIP